MIPVRPSDIGHKTQLLKLLTEIADNNFLAQNLYFKGGTCASMLGFLDRFSIDLNFDLNPKADISQIDSELKKIGLELTLDPVFKTNIYKPQYLVEINRFLICQTVETMFANKLVAVTNRWQKHHSIAGRDIYDIQHFFVQGYSFETAVIQERTGLSATKYLADLINFIEKHITQTIINEDLNTLLILETFQKIRKTLKQEVLTILKSQI